MEVRGVEAFFLCLSLDNSVEFIHYRIILYEHYDLSSCMCIVKSHIIHDVLVKVCDEYA